MANRFWLAGPNSKFKPDGKQAGFPHGIWHGLVAWFTFLTSIFSPKIRIYEKNNQGRRYDLGFLLGRAIALGIVILLFIFGVAPWCLRATPKGDSQGVDVAIILGFGYEQTPEGEMRPGAANEFLLHWVLKNYPQVKTVLVQEGVWTSACKTSDETCELNNVKLLRIHRHDPKIDVNTFETAVCAVKRMKELGKKRAVLVAHHLQLWRAEQSFEQIRKKLYEDCQFIIPEVPETPYPCNSVQWRTRSEFIYIFVELYARCRDWRLAASAIPDECVAPVSNSKN